MSLGHLHVDPDISGHFGAKSNLKTMEQEHYQTYARTKVERRFWFTLSFSQKTTQGKNAENGQKWHLLFFCVKARLRQTLVIFHSRLKQSCRTTFQ